MAIHQQSNVTAVTQQPVQMPIPTSVAALRNLTADNKLTPDEWVIVEQLARDGHIEPDTVKALNSIKVPDNSIIAEFEKSTADQLVKEITTNPKYASTEAARKLKSGEVQIKVISWPDDSKEAHIEASRLYDPTTRTLVVSVGYKGGTLKPVLSASSLGRGAGLLVVELNKRVEQLEWDPTTATFRQRVAAAKRLLNSSDAGRRAIASLEAQPAKINLFESSYLDFSDPKRKWIFDINNSKLTESYATAFDSKSRTVSGIVANSPVMIAQQLLYAQGLLDSSGDFLKADATYKKHLHETELPGSDSEVLRGALDLLKSTPSGSPIAEALIADTVKIEFTDKDVRGGFGNGVAGGVFDRRSNTIKLPRKFYPTSEALVSTLAHEGQHYLDAKHSNKFQGTAKFAAEGVIGFVTAPFHGKNPLTAAAEKSMDTRLDTERNAFTTQAKVLKELGYSDSPVPSHKEITDNILHAEANKDLYGTPDALRFALGLSAGLFATSAASTGMHVAGRILHRPGIDWKTQKTGMALTAGIMVHDYLNRHLEGDDREAFNIARIGLGTTAALAGAKYVSSKFMGSAALAPFKLRYAFGATALAVGVDYLKNKLFD